MRRRSKTVLTLAALAFCLLLMLLSGPAATFLQARDRIAGSAQTWDTVYLVCGARAQQRRLEALTRWMEQQPSPPPLILVGNDTGKSFWSRQHQRNLTRAEWAVVALDQWKEKHRIPPDSIPRIQLVPGTFSNTDGEMQALATAMETAPELERIAIVTSRFHARRLLQRLEQYAPGGHTFAVVPGVSYWENRAPWIVAGEYLKMLRDALGLSQTHLFSRPLAH